MLLTIIIMGVLNLVVGAKFVLCSSYYDLVAACNSPAKLSAIVKGPLK